MYRANIPADLDVLDSPLLSSNPLGSAMLGSMPGSALAERIFNDPCSWEASDDFDDDIPIDPVAWFVEEVEKFKLNSASSTDSGFSLGTDDALSVPPEKVNLMPSPTLKVKDARDRTSQLKGIRRNTVRPISLNALFERTGEDLAGDVQAHLIKIIESGGGPPGISRPNPSEVLSPPSTGSSATTESSSIPTASTERSDIASPAPIYSASTTLSFLELYLDSPRMESFRKSIYAKSQRTPAPILHIPSPKSAQTRPSSLLSPTLSNPDLSVEPPKRGSSVPPLDKSPLAKVQPVEDPAPLDASPPRVSSPHARPSSPPGLSRANSSTPEIPSETPSFRRPSVDSQIRSLPYPTAPPPYARTPSPSLRSVAAESMASSPSLATASLSMQGSGTPISAQIRRLPSIPPQSFHSATPQSALSPLPSSLPTSLLPISPEASQTIIYHGRPLSAVRSPLGGPAGPRSRSSGSRYEHSSSCIKVPTRSTSGLSRRPPVLQL